jgi:flagellar hook-associated protein 2
MFSLEARPMDLVEAKRQIEEQKLSSFQDLKNKLQTFKSVVSTLNTESRFTVNKGEFSNNSVTDGNKVVDITTTSSASSGTFPLTVNNLATETNIISDGFATTTSELEKGNIDFTVGGVTTSITIDDTNNTLDGLRLAINNLGLDIKASFLDDGDDTNPVRLLISGTKTGKDNAITIDNSISRIEVDSLVVTGFTTTQTAQFCK